MDSTQTITMIITIALISIIIPAILKAMKKKEKDMSGDSFVIAPPKIVLWIGIICFLVFAACL